MTKRLLTSMAIATMIMLLSCNNSPEKPSFDEVITSRRSVRSYDATKSISEAEVRTLLTAAQESPSWANVEPTKYYVVMSEEKRAALLEQLGGNKRSVAGAPVLIISTFEKGKSGFHQGKQLSGIGESWGAYDNGLSNAFLILQARAMGFDTLIMGVGENDAIRSEFGIPENEAMMAVIALGYRSSEPSRPKRRPLDEIVRFY